MPSKKGIEQALTWLKSKANDKENTLDSINAELCINVIMSMQRQYDLLGAKYGSLQNRKRQEEGEKGSEQLSFLN